VRVIGDRADALQRIPGSGTLIGQKEIQRAQPFDAAEMLRRVPGVQVRQEEGAGLRLDIGVRGLDPGRSRRVLVLEDGIPVAINPYAEPDLYYAPQIERMRGIEVVKGSGAILFGPQTVGGVINFLTLAPREGEHASVDVQYGERQYLRTIASYGNGNEHVRYVAQAFYKRGDGFRQVPFESIDGFAKVSFATSSRGELTLKLGFHEDRATSDDVGLTREMFARTPRRPTLKPYDRTELRRVDASATHEHRFAESTKVRTLLYAYTTARVWRRQAYTRAAQPGVLYERIAGDTSLPDGALYFLDANTILDRSYDVAGLEPRLEHRFRTGEASHTVDVGARVLFESARYETRTGGFARAEAGALTAAETHSTSALAAYLQDRVAFRNDLLVTPGLRVEHARFVRRIQRAPTGVTPEDVLIRGTSQSTALVPGIGMVYGTAKANVFGGIHVGYAPPRVTSSINPRGEDQLLSPEENIQYELGTRVSPAKWAKLEATGFLTNFRNQIIASTAQGADGTELVDAGKTRHYGAESAADIRLRKALSLPVELDLLTRYTYVRAFFVHGAARGNLLPYAPEHTVSTTVDVEHDVGFGGEVSYTFVGRQFTDPANTLAEDVTGRIGVIPSRHIVDLGARFRHRASGVTIKLLVKNALDDVYIISRRPEGIFAAGFRQVLLGIRWDWEASPRSSGER
jgi:Fe(3+) dicitrate transport protein